VDAPGDSQGILSSLGAGIATLALIFSTPAVTQGVPPPSVIVQSISERDITDRVNFVGNVEAIQKIDLRARVEGFLEAVNFAEGSMVQPGALLYQIERAPYAYALAQAEATLGIREAGLAAANALLTDKQLEVSRRTDLAKQQFAPQAALDRAVADRDEAAAAVQRANAEIKSAKAQIDIARLNLSYTAITSPIAGRISKTAVTVGNLVSPSTGILATVVQISPIRVAFSIPERDYVSIMKFLATPGAAKAPGKDDLYQPRLILPDGTPYPQTGKIDFINNHIETSTGTAVVRAVFDNPDALLLPGEYVSVTVQTGQTKSSVVVPSAAIQRNAQGPYVFIVDTANHVQLRSITLGLATDDGYAVERGLRKGDVVIVDGIQKVRPGMRVQPTSASPSSLESLKH
jgi:membrane fusion protein (multidrug efflux system)